MLLGSTGGISHLLPVEPVLQGILAASEQLRREGDVDFQQAIQTTDAFEKRANLEVAAALRDGAASAPSARGRA